MNFNLNVKSNLIISGQGFYLSSSLPFVTLNPNSEVQPHPADRVSSVPRGTCTPGWKQTARDSTLCWVYARLYSSRCPSCQETEFLLCSSVITSSLGIPISFQIQCTHFLFLVHFFVRLLCS